jgi:GT2 family glycosyltransferase
MNLPDPPSLAEIQAHIPRIDPVSAAAQRPFWSVMIPTYNCGRYLERTLASVLRQSVDAGQMQIEVVDGRSTKDDPEALVQKVGGTRVGFHRLPANCGAAHTFNHCLQRARGHWVHILHGDDMVLPGFYDAYQAVIQNHPQAGMVLGQTVTVDEEDRWIGVYGVHPPMGGGILPRIAERLASEQVTQFPAVAVRRDAYEQAGGFCTLFHHVTDWDMWFRLAQLAAVACVGQPFAQYRLHNESETRRLLVSALTMREKYFLICANQARLQVAAGCSASAAWRAGLAKSAEATAWCLDNENCTEGRYHHARWAWMLEPNWHRFNLLLKSWLKHQLKGIGTDPCKQNP